MKKTFIGSFPNKERLVFKIQELKIEGVDEQDMFIVMKDELAVDQLRKHANEEGEDSPFNLFNRFMGFLAGEKNVRQLLRDSGFTDEEAKQYFDAVQEGALLLCVNGKLKKHNSSYNHQADIPHFAPIPLDEIEAEQDSRTIR